MSGTAISIVNCRWIIITDHNCFPGAAATAAAFISVWRVPTPFSSSTSTDYYIIHVSLHPPTRCPPPPPPLQFKLQAGQNKSRTILESLSSTLRIGFCLPAYLPPQYIVHGEVCIISNYLLYLSSYPQIIDNWQRDVDRARSPLNCTSLLRSLSHIIIVVTNHHQPPLLLITRLERPTIPGQSSSGSSSEMPREVSLDQRCWQGKRGKETASAAAAAVVDHSLYLCCCCCCWSAGTQALTIEVCAMVFESTCGEVKIHVPTLRDQGSSSLALIPRPSIQQRRECFFLLLLARLLRQSVSQSHSLFFVW